MTSQLSDTTMAHSDTTIAPSDLIEDPVQSIFALYQQRFVGSKRISYHCEYKLAAIKRVKAGNIRFGVAKDLNITESMLGKWVIKESEILAMRRGGLKLVSGRQAKFPLLEDLSKDVGSLYPSIDPTMQQLTFVV